MADKDIGGFQTRSGEIKDVSIIKQNQGETVQTFTKNSTNSKEKNNKE